MSDTDDLRALMEADRWIERVSAQRTHLPEITELAAVEAELRSLLKALHDAEGDLAPIRSRFESVAAESARLVARAKDLDAKLSVSTANARELSAIQTELEHVRTLQSTQEDLELELMEEVEPREHAIDTIKHTAQPLVARRSELQGTITSLQSTLEDELVSLHTSRDGVARALPPPLLTRYEAALRRAGTSGAANVIEGRCDGCRLALSPLDRDKWKAVPEGSFMDCPECGRLLLP